MQTADKQIGSLGQTSLPAERWAGLGEVWRRPLPALSGKPMTRFLTRLALTGGRIASVRGEEFVAPARDPFIVAFNHSTRAEALIAPSVLAFSRRGKLVHFLADWNFLMIPLVGLMIRRGESIIVSRKPARPRFLNRLRPLYVDSAPPLRRAMEFLRKGKSIGIFPEGTVNRDPQRLLPGDRGAARLSLESGAPVIPAGIRFPAHSGNGPVPEMCPIEFEFGPPLRPPAPSPGRAKAEEVREWHARIMLEIARLSGKRWESNTNLQHPPK